jgi:heme exporter protein D
MDFAAPHIGFVLAAYGLSVVVLAGLIARTLFKDRALQEEVRKLEAQRKGARP